VITRALARTLLHGRDAAEDGIAKPALHDLAIRNLNVDRRRKPGHAAGTSKVSERRCAPLATLREALPAWLEREARAGEIRATTTHNYAGRLATWLYPHATDDGRLLGDMAVNAVTREQIGTVMRRIREAGRSLGVVEAIRNSLARYYASIVKTPGYVGVNPAADLREFVGRGAYKRAKARTRAGRQFFSQEEGPQLFTTARAVCPRYAPFIMTGVLGGLRWGRIRGAPPRRH
jgi:hypothetical protein